MMIKAAQVQGWRRAFFLQLRGDQGGFDADYRQCIRIDLVVREYWPASSQCAGLRNQPSDSTILWIVHCYGYNDAVVSMR